MYKELFFCIALMLWLQCGHASFTSWSLCVYVVVILSLRRGHSRLLRGHAAFTFCSCYIYVAVKLG